MKYLPKEEVIILNDDSNLNKEYSRHLAKLKYHIPKGKNMVFYHG